MKYAWITRHRDLFPIAVMCDVLLVSTSGYYASLGRQSSPRGERHQRIQQAVQQVHAGAVEKPREGGVVAGQHGELFAGGMHRAQTVQGKRFAIVHRHRP